jgi:hypothetical protein
MSEKEDKLCWRGLFLLVIISSLIFCEGCQIKVEKKVEIPREKRIKEEVLPPPPEIPPPPKYTYKAEGRDPFLSLVTKGVYVPVAQKKKKGVFDLESLRLSGFIWDEKGAMALLYDKEKRISYILKNGKLFDPGFEPVKGVKGEIREGGIVYLVAWGEEILLTPMREIGEEVEEGVIEPLEFPGKPELPEEIVDIEIPEEEIMLPFEEGGEIER